VFLLLAGALEVTDDGRSVAALRPGDVFGETAYLLREARSCDVTALSDDTRILSLSERTLHDVTEENPLLGTKLLGNLSKTLCSRLARTTHEGTTDDRVPQSAVRA
jgi:CRP-like cAMP-binding protein